jgi:predicted nucleotidyltransferase
MRALRIEQTLRDTLINMLRRYHVPRAGIFGSVARGTAHSGSDLDILFQPPPGMGYLQLTHMRTELETALGCPVDLVTYASLHPAMRENVYQDYIELYDDRPSAEQGGATSLPHEEARP